MTIIRIAGKPASKSVSELIKGTPILRYTGGKKRSDLLINYGLAGKHLASFHKKYPSSKKVPTLNKVVGYSKYNVIKKAERKDIKVPETKLSLSKKDNKNNWIEKRTNSIGGIGIVKARKKKQIDGKYYQEFIENRKYELRVHAFNWMKNWHIQKRVGSKKEIAWNYKNGGKFITIRNQNHALFQRTIKISKEILDMLNMSFGAVDFIVDTNNNLYFIEINSAPGFQALSKDIYLEAFNKLTELKKRDLLKLV